MSLKFVNIHGEPVSTWAPPTKAKPAAVAKEAHHKGWRVEGFSPDRRAELQRIYECDRKAAADSGRSLPPWSDAVMTKKFKPKPVRARPFEARGAAEQMAEMATKAGWTHVIVVELSRGEAPKSCP